jgi:hypothetical protein
MLLVQPVPRVAELARPEGPPKLSPCELRQAQVETLAQPKHRPDPFTWLLVAVVNLLYGRQGSLLKFKVLELLAPLPYRAWERAAYRALTRFHRHTALARRVFVAMSEARAQQDNEAFHLLVLEELLAARGTKQGFVRARLLPRLMAGPYRFLCWSLFLVRPTWSYQLNANFEDHAEHEYMTFVAGHPELEVLGFESEALSEYGTFSSEADVLRQIGHDERVHKLESGLAALRPKLQL